MRKISKGDEPEMARRWKKAHPNERYGQATSDIRTAIRTACIHEQFFLCAYCCRRIDINSSHNEHLEAQHIAPNRTMDFHNIVASCNTHDQCGKAHGTKPLRLTPLMDECETEIKYAYSGNIQGLSERAVQCIDTLNLNSKKIQQARKLAVEGLQFEYGCPPREAVELDAELITILIKELTMTNVRSMKPYAPVLVNILKHEL